MTGEDDQPATIIVIGRPVTQTGLGALGDRDVLSIPYSVSTVTQDLIALRQIRALDALARIDPSVQVGYKAYDSRLLLRGFNVADEGLRLDGAPIGTTFRFPFEFLDQVEVQKGATGFLYGFVPPGGIVNHVLKRPTDTPLAEASVSFISPGNVLGRADVSGRVAGGTIGLRAQGFVERGRGYADGLDLRRAGAALAINWKPSDTLTFNADATYQDFDPRGSGFQSFFYFSPGFVPAPSKAFRRQNLDWTSFHLKTWTVGASADWKFAPGWTATVWGRWLEIPQTSNADAAVPGTGATFDYFNLQTTNRVNARSTQARIVGDFTTGAIGHHLVVAADIFATPFDDGPFGFDYIGTFPFGAKLDIPKRSYAQTGGRYRSTDQTQYGLVVSDTVDIGRLSLLAALRGVQFRQKALDATGATTARYDVDRMLPSVGVTWKAADAVSLYANYALGLEQGATAPAQASNAFHALGPVRSRQYEAGVKARVGKGLQLSTAVFQIERDYQYLDLSGARPLFTASGTQRHRGIEFTFNGAATDRLTLFGGFTLLDPKIVDVTGPIAGQRPVGVARRQASLQAEYRVLDGIFINGGVLSTGRRDVFIPNTASIAGFTVFDLGGHIETKMAGHPVSIAAGIENLFDKNYWAGSGFSVLSLGTPRLLRLTLTGRY